MAISRMTKLLLGFMLVLEIAGCAQDGPFRTGTRSIASVGDKTEVIVSGEPGASIASTVPDYPPDRKRDSKISGRVVDDHGRPVPNANVRLAIAGAKGGRVETVEADSSGAFTLHRLKQGSSYVVIAEAEYGDENLVGRVEAKAPQTSLKIRVYPKSESTEHFRTSSNSSHRRVGTASNIKDQDEEEVDLDRPSTRANREDLEPPAPEAESLMDRTNGSSEVEIRDNDGVDLKQDVEAIDRPRSTKSRQNRKPKLQEAVEETDDGENPLPPAIEASDNQEGAKSAIDAVEPTKPQVASGVAEPSTAGAEVATLREALAPDPSIYPSIDVPALSGVKDPQVIVASTSSQSLFDEPEATKPITKRVVRRPRPIQQIPTLPVEVASASLFEVEKSAGETLKSAGAMRVSRPDLATRRDSNVTLAGAEQTSPVDSARPPREVKWGEISENQEVPFDESLRRRPSLASKTDIPTPTDVAAVEASSANRTSRIRKDPALRKARLSTKTPQYESANRRIYDVQLPDTQGKLVSLKDFDSDLILLDFWGTWCAPCKTSIPQLIEFQKRFGAERLQVVGVACERAPVAKRLALVAKTQKELGMNYPVMVAGKDDPCILMDSLQVQFYPTMVLLNRRGEVILREEGATEITLTRLEHAIESSLQSK